MFVCVCLRVCVWQVINKGMVRVRVCMFAHVRTCVFVCVCVCAIVCVWERERGNKQGNGDCVEVCVSVCVCVFESGDK